VCGATHDKTEANLTLSVTKIQLIMCLLFLFIRITIIIPVPEPVSFIVVMLCYLQLFNTIVTVLHLFASLVYFSDRSEVYTSDVIYGK
jgi:hypothetical protein